MTTPADQARVFAQKLCAAGATLEATESDIGLRTDRLNELVGQLASSSADAIEGRLHGLPNAARELLEPHLLMRARALDAWRERVAETVNATEFVGLFDRSLIVVVLGKVNSGKSTLGNTIAGRIFRGMADDPYAQWHPAFVTHDAVEGERTVTQLAETQLNRAQVGELATKATECTTSIESFTLGGLSWVDTPGIHSMSPANQALALRYVEAAELVVYITSSDSPMRRGDIEELRGLALDDKPVLLVVSKFDEIEEDEDPNTGEIVRELVVKSDRSRSEQEAHIRAELEANASDEALTRSEVAFLSAEVARQAAVAGDAGAFAASGLPAFYDSLAGLITEDAVRLKARSPRKRFNTLVRHLVGDGLVPRSMQHARSIEGLLFDLDQLEEARTLHETDLRACTDVVRSVFRARAVPKLSELVAQLESLVEVRGLEAHTHAAEQEVQRVLSDTLESALTEVVGDILADFELAAEVPFSGFDVRVPSIKQRWKRVESDLRPLGRGVGRALGGAAGAAIAGALLASGPTGWATLGTMVAASLTSWLGGKLGSAVAGKTQKLVRDGTNSDEVLAKLLADSDKQLSALVELNVEHVRASYFGPFGAFTADLRHGLEDLRDALRALSYEESPEC